MPPAARAAAGRDSARPEVAVDLRQLEALLAWYATTWAQRFGRPYLVDRRADPRRMRTLLAWAAADGARDCAAWVRDYLRAYLGLERGFAAENGHCLGDALRPRNLCRPRRPQLPRQAASRPPAASPVPARVVMTAEQLEQLARLSGRRRAAGE